VLIHDITAVANSAVTGFAWRARSTYDVGLRFGRGCEGSIEFDGNGLARGVFRGLIAGNDIEFEGGRRESHGVQGSGYDVGEFEDEWMAFVDEAYGR